VDKKLKDFIAKNKGGSLLNKYADEVCTMREHNVPFRAIREWLIQEHGFETTQQNIYDWHKRFLKNKAALEKKESNHG
jgi:hypothetical protein